MPEGTAVVEVAEVITPPPVAAGEPTQPETKAEETPQDYKAQFEATVAEKAQLEQRLRTAQGQLKGKLDTEATLSGMRREISNLTRMIGALAKGQGDPEVAEKELARVQEQNQKEELQQGFLTQAQDYEEDFLIEAEDMGIEARLPNGQPNSAALHAVPELAEALTLWNQGWNAQNLTMLRKAARLAADARRTVQTAAYEKEEAEKRKRNG